MPKNISGIDASPLIGHPSSSSFDFNALFADPFPKKVVPLCSDLPSQEDGEDDADVAGDGQEYDDGQHADLDEVDWIRRGRRSVRR